MIIDDQHLPYLWFSLWHTKDQFCHCLDKDNSYPEKSNLAIPVTNAFLSSKFASRFAWWNIFVCSWGSFVNIINPHKKTTTEHLVDKWTRLSINVWTLWIWWKKNMSVWVWLFEEGSHNPKVLPILNINQIQIKRPLFAVEKRMKYHTFYGKLFQGLHIAESIFERHLRENNVSTVRLLVKNLHQLLHATTITTNTSSVISTMNNYGHSC